MRKLLPLSSQYTDVLIVDEVGSEYVNKVIPEGMSFSVLKTRNVIPIVIHVQFFIRLFWRLCESGINKVSFLSAIVDIIKPKIIITFIDNGGVIGGLNKAFPEIMVLAVQNAVRSDDFDCIGGWLKNEGLPVYFGFGEYEYELMKYKKINVEEYVLAGSLKLGLYLDEFCIKKINKERVCYISQYRDGMKYSPNDQYRKFVAVSEEVVKYTYRFSGNANYSMGIAMVNGIGVDKNEKGRLSYFDEMNFYADLLEIKEVEFQENDKVEFSAYDYAMNSGVLITVDSTLAFEMFGCGKKVLFCVAANEVLVKQRGVVKNIERLPKEVLLDSMDYDVFCKKLNDLIVMSEDEYLSLTCEARKYYMRCQKPYAHEVIKSYIQKNYPLSVNVC